MEESKPEDRENCGVINGKRVYKDLGLINLGSAA